MSFQVDAIVIGAGVVGLACARKLAQNGLETIVLEKANVFGSGISARNSEVIHAGLYYEPESLKAKLCRNGRDLLFAYCEDRGIAHRRVGKLVVATHRDQVEGLNQLLQRAKTNGVDDVRIVDAVEARKFEPDLSCVAALSSPSTGIIDSQGLMTALISDLCCMNGAVIYRTEVQECERALDQICVRFDDGNKSEVFTRYLINAAGLDAPVVAEKFHGIPEKIIPKRLFAKGNYFSLNGKSPFQHLIYPMPEVGGLGVHLTLDLHGMARFGPDVEWIDEPDYLVADDRKDIFLASIRKYWASCQGDRLVPAYAGVRPKIVMNDKLVSDFVIQDESDHGVFGLVNLFGIESPGLTSCLAIADEVCSRLQ